jgi:hypothetical protein
MGVDSELLHDSEEFFEMIENKAEDIKLDYEIDNFRTLLEETIDGWISLTDERLAHVAQIRLQVIWKLISRSEKRENYLLGEYYANLMDRLRAISGYEPDAEDDE